MPYELREQMKLASALTGICPLNKEKCMGYRCKLWKTFTQLDNQTTTRSLYDFLLQLDNNDEVRDELNNLLDNILLSTELITVYNNGDCDNNEFTIKGNEFKNQRIILRQKIESKIKKCCGELQFEYVSCNFNSESSTVEELGRVIYYARSAIGECSILIIADNLLNQSM